MRKRIMCKKKSSRKYPTLVETVVFATAILNLLNITLNIALTIFKMLDMI